MRKLLLLPIAFMLCATAIAQDTTGLVKTNLKKHKFVLGGDGIYLRDSAWRVSGFMGITLSQTALYQWAGGGTNNFSFLLGINGTATYKKGKTLWDNSLDAKWGMVANGLIKKKNLARENLQKNIDYFNLKTIVGYQIKKSLYFSGKLGFESQFSPSYDYSLTDTVNGRYRKYVVSKIAAPAILTIGPGLTWTPKEWFTLFFSPIEGKLTFVKKDHPGRSTDTLLDGSHVDAYYTDVDETRFGLEKGSGFMGELGAELDVVFSKEVVKNVTVKSHLNVFSSYMNKSYNQELPTYYANEDSMGTLTISAKNKYVPVVKWDNDIIFKVNKWLSATLSTKFFYQYNAQVPVDKFNNKTKEKGADGITDKDKFGKPVTSFNKLQIFEQFGIGLAVKF
jgi:hypothetical protein